MRVTEIDFYIHQMSEDSDVLHTACDLADKAWAEGLVVYVLASDEEQSQRMDELLWTFKQDSFVPHERWLMDAERTQSDPEALNHQMTQVLISPNAQPPAIPDVLINLGAEAPIWFNQCQRVAELVGADAQSKAAGRARYRHYREQLGDKLSEIVNGNDKSDAEVSDNSERIVALRTHKV